MGAGCQGAADCGHAPVRKGASRRLGDEMIGCRSIYFYDFFSAERGNKKQGICGDGVMYSGRQRKAIGETKGERRDRL